MLNKIYWGEKGNITRRTMIWNMISGAVYSLQSAFLLWVITRTGGLYDAGVFSILYTVTQTLASMGSYSMRNFQVSDTNNEFTFPVYYSSRIFTCAAMIICCIIYGLFNFLPTDSFITLIAFGLYRLVDGIEDVYHGEIQKRGRLDTVSIMCALRIIFSSVIFGLCYFISHNLALSSSLMFLFSVGIMLFNNQELIKKFPIVKPILQFPKVFSLLKTCFPVFFGAILYNYLVNAPKYAIDRNLATEDQTIFNIIFMPVFAINMLSSIIFKPLVGKIGEWWNSCKYTAFNKSVIRQCGVIVFLTLAALLGGYLLGIPVLSFIYGVDLSQYKNTLCFLLICGGITAMNAFLAIVLTVIRCQYFIVIGYVLGFAVNTIISDRLVSANGIAGAAQSYFVTMATILLLFITASILSIIVKKRYRTTQTI